MDFKKRLDGGYLLISDLDRIVRECRSIAASLGFTVRWKIKDRTVTAFIKYNFKHVVWTKSYTHDLPHIAMALMYEGVYLELIRREKDNREAVLRMRIIEQERAEERRIQSLPSWDERRKTQNRSTRDE